MKSGDGRVHNILQNHMDRAHGEGHESPVRVDNYAVPTKKAGDTAGLFYWF